MEHQFPEALEGVGRLRAQLFPGLQGLAAGASATPCQQPGQQQAGRQQQSSLHQGQPR